MTDPKDVFLPPKVEAALKEIGKWNGGDGSALVEDFKLTYASDGIPGEFKEIFATQFVQAIDNAVYNTPKGQKKPWQLPPQITAALETIGQAAHDKRLAGAFKVVADFRELSLSEQNTTVIQAYVEGRVRDAKKEVLNDLVKVEALTHPAPDKTPAVSQPPSAREIKNR